MNAAAMIDISALSIGELKALEKKVGKAISTFEDRKKKEALAELESKAKELGYSLAELTVGKPAKATGVPKYCNPDNADQTWTGKGRRPDWFNAAIAAGKTAEDLAI